MISIFFWLHLHCQHTYFAVPVRKSSEVSSLRCLLLYYRAGFLSQSPVGLSGAAAVHCDLSKQSLIFLLWIESKAAFSWFDQDQQLAFLRSLILGVNFGGFVQDFLFWLWSPDIFPAMNWPQSSGQGGRDENALGFSSNHTKYFLYFLCIQGPIASICCCWLVLAEALSATRQDHHTISSQVGTMLPNIAFTFRV